MNAKMESVISRRKEVVRRTKEILIDSLNLDLQYEEICEDSALFGFGLGLDSIDALTLLVAVEDGFQIQVPDENIVDVLRSVNTIADFIVRDR